MFAASLAKSRRFRTSIKPMARKVDSRCSSARASGTRTLSKDQGSRIKDRMVSRKRLDFPKSSFQRLPMAYERAGRRVPGQVLQENAQEEGTAEKPHESIFSLATHCSAQKRFEKSGPYFLKYVIPLKSIIPKASRLWDRIELLAFCVTWRKYQVSKNSIRMLN